MTKKLYSSAPAILAQPIHLYIDDDSIYMENVGYNIPNDTVYSDVIYRPTMLGLVNRGGWSRLSNDRIQPKRSEAIMPNAPKKIEGLLNIYTGDFKMLLDGQVLIDRCIVKNHLFLEEI